MPDTSRVLVTGGAGFIGSHIVERLIERGFEVGVLDTLATGDLRNLAGSEGAYKMHRVDIRDQRTLEEAMKGYNSVVHEAAVVSVTRSVEDPITTNSINVTGTVNVLRAALESGVERIIYASSSSVYGDSTTVPKEEEMSTRPISPYGVSKLSAELYCAAFARVYGLRTVSLRYFNVYGPRQRVGPYSGIIPSVVGKVSRGERPTIFGDGAQTRDFTYVEDVVEANLLALTVDVPPGTVFNIGSGRPLSINDLVATVLKAMGREDLKPLYAPEREGDVRASYADIRRASTVLGYRPRFGLEEGLRRFIEWFGTEKPE